MGKKTLNKIIREKIEQGFIKKCPECRGAWEERKLHGLNVIIDYPSLKYDEVQVVEYHIRCKHIDYSNMPTPACIKKYKKN